MYFEIQADDPRRAVDFYRQVFGWTITTAGEDLPVPYWRIRFGDQLGGLMPRPVDAPGPQQGTNAYVCSFEVDDVDRIAAAVADAGGQVALPKFAVPGVCWQGYFLDTEGNTFGVFAPDESAE
ncbi:MAG TPA: VOC family protein [Candidatus Stackebrandtia faecavium]|nr:VOC family protein [Candidatus Stackebrandtia faecavium]